MLEVQPAPEDDADRLVFDVRVESPEGGAAEVGPDRDVEGDVGPGSSVWPPVVRRPVGHDDEPAVPILEGAGGGNGGGPGAVSRVEDGVTHLTDGVAVQRGAFGEHARVSRLEQSEVVATCEAERLAPDVSPHILGGSVFAAG